MEWPEGKLYPTSETSRKPSGRGRCTMNLSAWLSTSTHARLSTTHLPGFEPGANAATTMAITRMTAGEASEEKPSMMGVSHSERRRTTKNWYARVSRRMISPSATSRRMAMKMTATMARTMTLTFWRANAAASFRKRFAEDFSVMGPPLDRTGRRARGASPRMIPASQWRPCAMRTRVP